MQMDLDFICGDVPVVRFDGPSPLEQHAGWILQTVTGSSARVEHLMTNVASDQKVEIACQNKGLIDFKIVRVNAPGTAWMAVGGVDEGCTDRKKRRERATMLAAAVAVIIRRPDTLDAGGVLRRELEKFSLLDVFEILVEALSSKSFVTPFHRRPSVSNSAGPNVNQLAVANPKAAALSEIDLAGVELGMVCGCVPVVTLDKACVLFSEANALLQYALGISSKADDAYIKARDAHVEAELDVRNIEHCVLLQTRKNIYPSSECPIAVGVNHKRAGVLALVVAVLLLDDTRLDKVCSRYIRHDQLLSQSLRALMQRAKDMRTQLSVQTQCTLADSSTSRPSPQGVDGGAVRELRLKAFINEHALDTTAENTLRLLPPEGQNALLDRGLSGCRNPSKELMRQAHLWHAAASQQISDSLCNDDAGVNEALNQFIEKNSLDEDAVCKLRALPLQGLKEVLGAGTCSSPNPSATVVARIKRWSHSVGMDLVDELEDFISCHAIDQNAEDALRALAPHILRRVISRSRLHGVSNKSAYLMSQIRWNSQEIEAIEQAAIEEVETTLRSSGTKRIPLEMWQSTYERDLGGLREFLQRHPQKFWIVPTSGRKYHVELIDDDDDDDDDDERPCNTDGHEMPAVEHLRQNLRGTLKRRRITNLQTTSSTVQKRCSTPLSEDTVSMTPSGAREDFNEKVVKPVARPLTCRLRPTSKPFPKPSKPIIADTSDDVSLDDSFAPSFLATPGPTQKAESPIRRLLAASSPSAGKRIPTPPPRPPPAHLLTDTGDVCGAPVAIAKVPGGMKAVQEIEAVRFAGEESQERCEAGLWLENEESSDEREQSEVEPSLNLVQSDGPLIQRGPFELTCLPVRILKYTQQSIGANFQDGRPLSQLVADLQSGKVDPAKHLCLEVVKRWKDGEEFLYSVDNRRLYCLKQFQDLVEHDVLVQVRLYEFPQVLDRFLERVPSRHGLPDEMIDVRRKRHRGFDS